MAFAAFLMRFKVRRRWIPAFFAVVYILYVISAAYAQSQDLSSLKEIVVRVRPSVSVIEKDVCKGIFKSKLEEKLREKNLKIPVRIDDTGNEYKSDDYLRYDGLLTDMEKFITHIECGPNSRSSGELSYQVKGTQEIKKYKDTLFFSEPFYSTNVKLLMEKNLAEKLNADTRQDKFKNIKIGIIPRTTTQKQFEKFEKLYPNLTEIPVKKTENTLENGLEKLENQDIQALASDGIILKSSLLNNKLKHPENYVIFPDARESKLPGLWTEEYVIVSRNIPGLTKIIDEIVSEVRDNVSTQLANYEGKQTSGNFLIYFLKNFLIPIIIVVVTITVISWIIYEKKRKDKKRISSQSSSQLNPDPPPRSDLSGQQFGRLRDALIASFPREANLREMLRTELELNLERVAGGNNLRDMVSQLIEYAEAHNKIQDLVRAARNSNPGNPQLRDIAEELLSDLES